MSILVAGGAGYIGSHTCVALHRAGYDAVIADDLSNAKPDVPQRIAEITGKAPKFYLGSVCDGALLARIFEENEIEAVIHFAGKKCVPESCRVPVAYYRNNLDATLSLLEAMERFGCKRMVFSSSATVYGANNPVPFTEDMPLGEPTNPYGQTKKMCERILSDAAAADETFSAVLLRYFNPIGAHESGLLGDDPQGVPNNLMPYIARVAAGQLEKLTVCGADYPTPDGTCRRDYLHVCDLADGHLRALEYGKTHAGAEAFNLGAGRGISVLEMVAAFREASGAAVPYVIGARRAGDIADCWADTAKSEALLGWRAERGVEQMCRDAWRFVCRSAGK